MARTGRPPGQKKTGGRVKGSKNRTTIIKESLLLSARDQFEAKDYNPLKEMIDLAQKPRVGKNDAIKFMMHQTLARKYWPDVSAVKVSGDPDNPLMLSVEDRRARLDALQGRLAARNGHKVEEPA